MQGTPKQLKMPNVNTVVIAGNLTRDPEVKVIPSTGTHVANIGLASNRWFKKNGEWEQETTYVDVKCWAQLAERVGENLKKGAPVLIEGSIRSEHWEDKATGGKRSKVVINATKIQFLERVGETVAVDAEAVDPGDLPF